MYSIYKKEIKSFFSSLTGYIVVVIYLLINGMFMWILPGEWNILDSGYAGLDTLFIISPWVFLFLVPSVTMRIFAEERRSGTIELLFSRPITERDILYGKYFASVTLVLIALVPCLIYYLTVYLLGATPGNIDAGGTVGAFIGLFFLASLYAAIGLFASSFTNNQVVAFMISVFFGFIMFIGFDSFALLPGLKQIDEIVISFGINEHYRSMSRGVIALNDILYFGVVIIIFTEATRLVLVSRNWRRVR